MSGTAPAKRNGPTDPPSDALRILGIWAVWGGGIVILAALAMKFPASAPGPWPSAIAQEAPPLARWDSGWYYQIAAEGYRYDRSQAQNNIGFYPLYPVLTRWSARLLHQPLFTVGIGISLIGLLGALFFLSQLTEAWGDRADVVPTISALLFYPTAFFLAAAYTESLFLLTTTATFWAARSRRWWLCGLTGAAACLTRFNGFLILLPILGFIGKAVEGHWRKIRTGHLFALFGTIAGAAAFPLFLWRRWGDPLLYVHSKATGWSQRPSPPWRLFERVLRDGIERLQAPGSGGGQLIFWLEVGSLLLFVGLTAILFKKGLALEGLYCAATLLLLFCSGTLDGIHRYVLALFPCFFVLGRALRRSPVLIFAYSFAGIGLGVSLMARFVKWLAVG